MWEKSFHGFVKNCKICVKKCPVCKKNLIKYIHKNSILFKIPKIPFYVVINLHYKRNVKKWKMNLQYLKYLRKMLKIFLKDTSEYLQNCEYRNKYLHWIEKKNNIEFYFKLLSKY